MAVALHRGFFETLPVLEEVSPEDADIAWLVYDLVFDEQNHQYQLQLDRKVYTLFRPALDQITTPVPGAVEDFLGHLQSKLDEKLDSENNPPDAPTLDQLL